MHPKATKTPSHNRSPWQRFWKFVEVTSGCWLWTGCTQRGYGSITINSKQMRAHRLSWELHNGPIPDGLFVLHNCPGGDNRLCVNPAHLWLGTHDDNMRDASAKGQFRTTAKHGESLPRGEAHANTHLTEDDVRAIRERYARGGISMRLLGVEYGIGAPAICLIVQRKRWQHI